MHAAIPKSHGSTIKHKENSYYARIYIKLTTIKHIEGIFLPVNWR